MKALSIRQPWAELVLRGLKDVENRSWRTHHRGPLLIHASQGADEPWYGDFGIPEDAPRGALVGVVDVIDCMRQRTSPWHSRGSWGFYLAKPRRLPRPVPWKASLGLFDVPDRRVRRALVAARADRRPSLDASLIVPPPPPRTLTMFSWGYEGWGNATRQLVRSFDLAEAYREHVPPIFVDIRLSRSVRAAGFRDDAFERLLGHERYRWFRSLGNPNVTRPRRGRGRVQCPDAVHQLVDLALDAARGQRRVIFFCSCGCPIKKGRCHRFDVAKLVRRVAAQRSVDLSVSEWPGERPCRWPQRLKVSRRTFETIRRKQHIDIPPGVNLARLASLAWGALIDFQSGDDRQLVSVGPARFSRGRWVLPVFTSMGGDASGRRLRRKVKRERRRCGLE